MEQAARSGVQNIAEGSVLAASSGRSELKLTNVARASLEELRLDYEDYLRRHGIGVWTKESPLYCEFIKRRVSCNRQFREFVEWAENQPPRQSKDGIVANAALLLIEAASFFLGQQIKTLSEKNLNPGRLLRKIDRTAQDASQEEKTTT